MVGKSFISKICALLAALVLFSAAAYAASIQITEPVKATAYDGSVIDFGVVGPGQSMELVADTPSGDPAKADPTKIATWDQFNFVPSSLPAGWNYTNGLTYESSFHAFLKVSPQANDGDYTFQIRPVDEYKGSGPLTFTGKVRVSHDMFALSASPAKETVAVGTPAVYTLVLDNEANAPDSFNITVSGFPGAEQTSEIVTVLRQSTVTTQLEIVSNEQATYPVMFTATSLSSARINATATTQMTSKASLVEDVKSAGYGMLLFSNSQQAVIGFLTFAANLFDPNRAG